MFTIKLYKTYGSTASKLKSISCPSYEVYKREGKDDHGKDSINVTVTVFPGLTATEGVEFHIGEGEHYYDVCFVENASGKTIERHGDNG